MSVVNTAMASAHCCSIAVVPLNWGQGGIIRARTVSQEAHQCSSTIRNAFNPFSMHPVARVCWKFGPSKNFSDTVLGARATQVARAREHVPRETLEASWHRRVRTWSLHNCNRKE
jgi:hypothetical protein